MKQVIKLGVTDRTFTVFIPDSASTVGKGKTGLVAANLTVSYTRVETDNDVTVTDVTSSLNNLSALTDAHNDWGLLEVSATLAPGLYRLDCADAVFAFGAWSAVVYVCVTTGLAAASPMEFILVAYDQLDGVRLGLTALPNAAAEAAGGLYTRGTGAGQINQPANGMIDVNDVRLLGTAWETPTVAGRPNVNAKTWNDLTTVELPLVPETAGRKLDVSAGGEAGLDWANIGSPTTAQNLSGTNIDVDQVVASVSGAVGSVTGAVGSVTAGVTLAASAVQAIWDALTSALTTVGSIGKKLADWVIGTSQTGDSFARLGAPVGASVSADVAAVKVDTAAIDDFLDTEVAAILAAVDTEVGAIKTKTDQLIFTVANQVDSNALSGGGSGLDAAGVRSAVGLASANLDTQLDALPTNAELETADDTVLAAIAALPANILTTVGLASGNLDTQLSAIDDLLDTEIPALTSALAAVKAKTDSLTFTAAGHVDANIQRINDVALVGDGSGTPFNV